MSRIALVLLLAVSLVAVCLAGAASAQVINACVKTKNGALRIVSDPADCTSRETPISWNQQGPQGDPGLNGADAGTSAFSAAWGCQPQDRAAALSRSQERAAVHYAAELYA